MEISIETRADYVHAVVGGEYDRDAAQRGMAAILSACRHAGLNRVLIDGRGITTRVSVADRREIATSLGDAAPIVLSMAIVVSRENMFTKTLEDTAHNFGVDVRTTDSIAEALAFLGLQKPIASPAG